MPARFRRDRHVGKDQVWHSRPWATNASATAPAPSASISASHPKHLIFTDSSSSPQIFITTSKKHSLGIDGASIAAGRIAEEKHGGVCGLPTVSLHANRCSTLDT